jgi:hypothetical protein
VWSATDEVDRFRLAFPPEKVNMNRLTLWTDAATALSSVDSQDVLAAAAWCARSALVLGMALVLGDAGANAAIVTGQRLLWRLQQISG